MMKYKTMLLTAFIAVIACNSEPETETVHVGSHHVSVAVPDGWEHLDYGREHHFRKGIARISLTDMGPARFGVDHAVYHVLRELDHNDRRNIASKEHSTFHGREALLIDTWDRLTHQSRQRMFLVVNDSVLLVAHTGLGDFAEMEVAFDELVTTMVFADDGAASAEEAPH